MQHPYSLAARTVHFPRLALVGSLLTGVLLLAACTHTPAPVAGVVFYQPTALRVPQVGLPAARSRALVPADTSDHGMATIWADLRRRSYFLDPAADAPTVRLAGNRAQHLSARLAPATYTLTAAVPLPARPRPGAAPAAPAAKPAWTLGLTLRGIGRGDRLALRPVAVPTVAAATDTSVRYQHGAGFAVEYTNTPAGVRQN